MHLAVALVLQGSIALQVAHLPHSIAHKDFTVPMAQSSHKLVPSVLSEEAPDSRIQGSVLHVKADTTAGKQVLRQQTKITNAILAFIALEVQEDQSPQI